MCPPERYAPDLQSTPLPPFVCCRHQHGGPGGSSDLAGPRQRRAVHRQRRIAEHPRRPVRRQQPALGHRPYILTMVDTTASVASFSLSFRRSCPSHR